MKTRRSFAATIAINAIVVAFAAFIASSFDTLACTGIRLKASDGSVVTARTIEWAATPMTCGYTVVPRGHQHQSMTPQGTDGLKFKSKYGYVALWAEYDQVVVEGMNETGLNAGLFFFPDYCEYPEFNPKNKAKTLADMQFVSWVLANFSTIDEMKSALASIDVVGLDSRMGGVHWRITEPSGRTVVIEYTEGKPNIYENPLGVLTNAPGFQWQMTNLNNYVNLFPGNAPATQFHEGVTLKPFGGNSGMLGLPGDYTPPSRFVRAAFFQTTAPVWPTAFETVRQAFHILNNFDIPVGLQRSRTEGDQQEVANPANMPSATQFTAVSDQANHRFYFTTCWNMQIRCIDLKSINFKKVKYTKNLLDNTREQPVEMLKF